MKMNEITNTYQILNSKSEKDLFHIIKFSHAPASYKKKAKQIYKVKFGKLSKNGVVFINPLFVRL